jgi:hypothetical protein
MSYLVVSLSALFAFVQVAGAELSAKAKAAIDANEAGRRAINTISYKLKSTSSSDRQTRKRGHV